MNFLDAMRRGNRNQSSSGDGSKRKTASGSVSAVPSSPSTSTSRHPQGSSVFGSSSSSLVSEGAESSSSLSGNPRYGPGGRVDREVSRAAPTRSGRTERSHTVSSVRDKVAQAGPSTRTASSERSTSSLEQDLYTRNELASFIFGNATSAVPPVPSIDPLSPHDDADYEDLQHKSDITPRPSVAGPSSQRPGAGALPAHAFLATSMSPERRRKTSHSSTNTFGTSSASASATSLSSNPVDSRHGGFITTPQTSSNEYTSDDDISEHRHPLTNFSRNSPTSTLESYSEEEFDDDYDDDRSEPDIDVSSEIHEEFGDFTWNASRQSIASSAFSRKRSLAVPIPSSSPDARDREDSLATLRRPSRSLEGLRSDSLEQSNHQASQDNRPSPVSPTSMPESIVDWRDLRRRSIQRDKERAGQPAGEQHNSEVVPTSGATVTGAPPPAQNSAFEGFDATWANSAGGIVDLDWDPSEMADIVGGIQGPSSSSHRSYRRDSSSSTISGRRLSTTSTSSDPFTHHLKHAGGQNYADERAKWIFTLDPNGLHAGRGHERERSSISSVWGARSSFSSSSMMGSSVDAIAPFASGGERRRGGKDKQKETVWKGMAPESEESWMSGTNGRYKVVRKNQTAEGKAPQQRLHITHHRNNPYSQKYDKSDGPSITIHKHSKAVAFSISRHYRPKEKETPGQPTSTSARHVRVPMPVDRRRASPMILLASRKVQEAYTSTNTTRKLDTHGLLSENGRPSSRDRERLARFVKEDEEKAKLLKKEQKKQEKSKGKGKGKDKSAQPSMSDLTAVASSSDSSNGSVNTDSQPGPSTAQSRSTRLSVDHSVRSQDTVSSGRTITYQRRESEILLSDEDDEFRPKIPNKTTHAETYATLAPDVLESIAHNESHVGGLWGWGKKSTNLFQRQVQSAYKPPWPISQPRYHDRKGIVEDLNTSFQDVGLLPAVDEVRASQKRKQQRAQQEARNAAATLNAPEPDNVFTSFPSDLLYLLLPLWPGETDAQAEAKTPFTMPHIPVEKRLFLLLHYTPQAPDPPLQEDKGKKASKKSSRGSPTSSRDSVRVEKSILFHRFHFSARIVTYGDIQGSGVRSPDAGLSVIGPLQEAYETMPTSNFVDTEFIMLGWCQSRNRGIEFVPEGLEKLGLARRELDPNAPPPAEDDASFPKSSEDQEEPATIHVLTPIGRAVVEMAWLGSMALTSFG